MERLYLNPRNWREIVYFDGTWFYDSGDRYWKLTDCYRDDRHAKAFVPVQGRDGPIVADCLRPLGAAYARFRPLREAYDAWAHDMRAVLDISDSELDSNDSLHLSGLLRIRAPRHRYDPEPQRLQQAVDQTLLGRVLVDPHWSDFRLLYMMEEIESLWQLVQNMPPSGQHDGPSCALRFFSHRANPCTLALQRNDQRFADGMSVAYIPSEDYRPVSRWCAKWLHDLAAEIGREYPPARERLYDLCLLARASKTMTVRCTLRDQQKASAVQKIGDALLQALQQPFDWLDSLSSKVSYYNKIADYNEETFAAAKFDWSEMENG